MERVHRMRRADETFEASSWDAWTRTPLVQPPNGPRFELFVDFKRKDQAVSFKGCKYPVESGKILRSNVFCSFYWPLSDRFATRNSDDGNKKKRARPTKRLGEAKKQLKKKPKKNRQRAVIHANVAKWRRRSTPIEEDGRRRDVQFGAAEVGVYFWRRVVYLRRNFDIPSGFCSPSFNRMFFFCWFDEFFTWSQNAKIERRISPFLF